MKERLLGSSQEQYKSLEYIKEIAKDKLYNILYKPLTVENIENFANEALDEVILLIEKLLKEYKDNPNLEGNLNLNKQQQEDDVCSKLDLPNIPEIIKRILEVKDNIDSIKVYIEKSKNTSNIVITPPDELNISITKENTYEKFEKKKLIPRLLTLMYILQNDMYIDITDKKEVDILEGIVTDNMMRKKPYLRITVPSLNRIVYICDEEGNTSYVFDMQILKKLNISLENDLDIDGKRDKNSLISMYKGVGIRVIQTSNWRNRMRDYLENDIPKQIINIDTYDIESKSEFEKKDKKEFLSYLEFCTELKSAWNSIQGEKPTSVTNWYKEERKKGHESTWPSDRMLKSKYEKDGFIKIRDIINH